MGRPQYTALGYSTPDNSWALAFLFFGITLLLIIAVVKLTDIANSLVWSNDEG